MQEKNKKMLLIISILVIIILSIIILIILSNKKEIEQLGKVELSELINIEDIENLKYDMEKTEEEISSKYVAIENKYEVKANIQAEKTEGKMIYVRENYDKLNIYKVEYTLNKYEDKTTKVKNIIQEFVMLCEGYMDGIEGYKETEELYGESSVDFELPIEESVYNEERLYSKTYKNEEYTYDINFYRKDDKVICEFAKIL